MAGDWRVGVLKGLGAPLTKQNLNFLSTWQRWEGGHTKNSARFNWLNTTSNSPGATHSINSVGVKAFDSFENGVNATVQTLNNGHYPDILDALRKGDPYKVKPVKGLGTWLAGPGAASSEHALRYASRVLGSPVSSPKVPKASGQGNARVVRGGQMYGGGESPIRIDAASDADRMWNQALSGFMMGRAQARLMGQEPRGGLLQLAQLRDTYEQMGGVPDLRIAPGAVPASKVPGRKGNPKIKPPRQLTSRGSAGGDGILLSRGWKPTPHAGNQTSGLGWGPTGHTSDIMGDPGTPVRAPEPGRIIKHGSAQEGGQSITFVGDSGRVYWLGHIDNLAPVGARVGRDQVMARISGEHPRPHLHVDMRQP